MPKEIHNVLSVIGSPEPAREDGVNGFRIHVQGGTLFLKRDEVPADRIEDFELHETLEGEGPIKNARYAFRPKA